MFPSMPRYLLWLSFTCSLLPTALSASIHIQIPPSTLITNPNTLPPSTHATLTSGSGVVIRSPIRKDSSIVFSQIESAGSHLLKIYTRDFVFASYRIDIASVAESTQISGAWETFLGSPWTDAGVSLIPATANGESAPTSSLTLHPKVLVRKQFYEDRPGFNPLTLLKNPMILMGGVAMLFTFGMPKLMENMDPEMKAEYEEMQKSSPVAGITRAMQGQSSGGGSDGFNLAGYLAGQSTSGGKTSGRDSGNIRERKK